MAQGSNEHRMVFDIRGRRRYVVKVVYAILAVLMAASLFLVTGAINLNSIFGGNTNGESAASSLEKQAQGIEARLAKAPEDEGLLVNLTRTRISVANALVGEGAFESEGGIEEVKQQLAQASEDWSRYEKAAGGEPIPGLAIQVAPALFQLAEVSSGGAEILANVKAATEAQEIVAEARPSLNSSSTLAFFKLYAQDFKGAAAAKEEALKYSNTKFERETFENKYEEVEKSAKKFGSQVKAEEATKSKSAGKESLENPVQGLGGSALGGSAFGGG